MNAPRLREGKRTVRLSWCIGACLGACLGGCRDERAAEPPALANTPATPDRLSENERLPDAEIAFGLPLPSGLHLVRHFNDAAYFSGDLAIDVVIEHLRKYVRARDVEAQGQGIIFPRAQLIGDDAKRLLRIELRPLGRGTQLHIQDITPPPALTGANDADIWRKAGRNPDGTPIDQNRAY
jgi:hypothetical protein